VAVDGPATVRLGTLLLQPRSAGLVPPVARPADGCSFDVDCVAVNSRPRPPGAARPLGTVERFAHVLESRRGESLSESRRFLPSFTASVRRTGATSLSQACPFWVVKGAFAADSALTTLGF